MDAETYRVDIAFEYAGPPTRPGMVAERLATLLPPGSQLLRGESTAASPDGLARIAATVPAFGPAQALRDLARSLELIAAEAGLLDELGPMRRTVVEYLADAPHGTENRPPTSR
jgi:hypothetical protein